MKKIKYIMKRFVSLNWQNMFQIAKKIAKKTHRSTFVIFCDIIFCAILYGTGYMDYFEFEFYLLNNKERKTYLTTTLNNSIIAKYNDKEAMKKFSDKILFNQIFKKYLHHDFIDIREENFKSFQAFCQNKDFIVGKIIDSCGGKGIDIYDLKKWKDLKKLYEHLKEQNQFLIEEKITQHPKMAKLYPKSINTLRVISFLDDQNEVHILEIILRIGNGGEVDNFSSGGMYTFIDESGKAILPAIDEEGKIYETHPITQEKIVGFTIPNYETIYPFIKKIATVVKKVRYVGWDIAMGIDGPVLIEGNEYSGIFQMKPSLSGKKEGLLPVYKKYMDL